jgi:hypothetical protein
MLAELEPRVRAAVLKLAAGDLEKLRALIKTAQSDFRDVLAWAEYPGYFGRAVAVLSGETAPADQQRIIGEDWKQYQDWLRRSR